MARRIFLALTAACTIAAMPAFADVTGDVVAQLQSMGFSRVVVERTLLGRVKIEASGTDGNREIILNPRTGEILRDVFWPIGQGGNSRLLSGSGDGSDDRDDDDRDDDDNSGSESSDDDDDNSGSGSDDDGGSGSSGGDDDNSGSGSDSDDDDDDDDDDD